MNFRYLILSVLIVLFAVEESSKGNEQESPIRLELVVSDQTILVGDALYLKLRIANRLDSTVLVSGRDKTKFQLLLECREGKQEWRDLGDIRKWRVRNPEGTPSITIDPKETYAIYGLLYLHPNLKSRLFDHVGEYEIRLRMHCMLGEFVTDSTVIIVRDRPKAEMELLLEDGGSAAANYQSFFYSCTLEQELFPPIQKLRMGLHSGAIDKSLELTAAVESFLATGTIDRAPSTFKESFDKLSKGLDEVRKDYLAMVLTQHAIKKDKLEDAALIVAEIKDDGLIRGNLLFALNNKLRRKKFPRPNP